MRAVVSTIGAVLCVFAISTTALFAEDDLKELRKTIESINDKITKAIIEEDVETVFSFYTDDVISMPNYDAMIKGKEALRKHDEGMRKAGFKIHSLNATILDLWVCGDLAYEVGKFGISLTVPGIPHPVADSGKYMTIWRKQSDGSYKVKAEIWNTDTNPWTTMHQ